MANNANAEFYCLDECVPQGLRWVPFASQRPAVLLMHKVPKFFVAVRTTLDTALKPHGVLNRSQLCLPHGSGDESRQELSLKMEP